MYKLPRHEEKNQQRIKELIDQFPFAFITGCNSKNEPVATQVPVFIEEREGKKVLRGHIMNGTDHHKCFLENENVLVVFTGRHTYVSATWYSNPHMGSTWNYMSVHIKGKVRFLDEAGLADVLRKTSLHFEGNDSSSATAFDNLPPKYLKRLMPAISAFEIEILEMNNVFKLSQDRDYESYQNIIEQLRKQDLDGQVIADEMEKRTKEVFNNSEQLLKG